MHTHIYTQILSGGGTLYGEKESLVKDPDDSSTIHWLVSPPPPGDDF